MCAEAAVTVKQDAIKSYMGLFSGNSPTEETLIEYELRTRTAILPAEEPTQSDSTCTPVNN